MYFFFKPFPIRGVKSHTSLTSGVYELVFPEWSHPTFYRAVLRVQSTLPCSDPVATEPGRKRLANSQSEESHLITSFLENKQKNCFGLFSLISSNKELPPPSTVPLPLNLRAWEGCISTTAVAACPPQKLRVKRRPGPCGRSARG